MQAVDFFVPMFEAIFAGYAVLFLCYMLLGFLVTRLGRRILMDGDRESLVSIGLFCIVWLVATFAACYVCRGLAPMPPEGPMGFPIIITALALIMVGRRFRQLPDHQSFLATAGFILMILGGTAGALYVKLVPFTNPFS